MNGTPHLPHGGKSGEVSDTWPQIFQDLCREEAAIKSRSDEDLKGVEFRHRKWRAIQKHLVENPFVIDPELTRANQWRAVIAHCDALFFEPQITIWLNEQVHIAENLAAGIRDLRPRKNGPCYDVFMEFVRNTKHKYHSLHRWLLDARVEGSALSGSVPPQMGDK